MDRPPSSTRHLYARLDQQYEDDQNGRLSSATAAATTAAHPPHANATHAIEVSVIPSTPTLSQQQQQAVNGWSCQACTFINQNMLSGACEMCQSVRILQQPSQSPLPPSPTSPIVAINDNINTPLMYPGIAGAAVAQQRQPAVAVAVAIPVIATPILPNPPQSPSSLPALPLSPSLPVILPVPALGDLVLVAPPIATREQFEHTVATRRVHFTQSKYLREAWNFFKVNWCSLLVGMIIVTAILIGFIAIAVMMFYVPKYDSNSEDPVIPHHSDTDSSDSDGGNDPWAEQPPTRHGGIFIDPFALIATMIPMTILSFIFTSAAYSAAFKALRTNTKFRWCDFCAAMGTDVGHTLWMSIVMTIITFGSFMIPFGSLITSFMFSLVVPLHRDNVTLSMRQALNMSAQIVWRYFCPKLGYLFTCALILIASIWIPFSFLVAIPVVALSHVFLYHHLIGINGVPVLVPLSSSSLNAAALAQNPLLHVSQHAN